MTGIISGSCHCGAHAFKAPPPDSVTRCTCSICSKRGHLTAFYPPEAVSLDLTRAVLTAYQWGDRMMTFHHCATCGCPVFAESDAWTTPDGEARPARLALNARLFDDFDLAAVPIRDVDGRNDW